MTEKINILIVDDDITNRMILRALLKETGYISFEAENGQQAVDACLNNKIDIVLMDVMMPVLNGYQAAMKIKSDSKTFIPIIFLTALADEESLSKCIEAGGDDFLTKPYNHVILRSKIDSMLRIRHLYKQIESQNIELSQHNARVEDEVDVAKNVFSSILKHDLEGETTGLKYSMSPATIFNGDMIIAERNQSNGLDVLISDFTGHGLSAAVGSLPVADIFYTMTMKGFSFIETLVEINKKLIKLLPTQMFMSSALISIDRLNNTLSVVNCGLPDIYLVRQGKVIHTFKSQHVPLGIMSLNHSSIAAEMSAIQYGDRIIAATDGLMEAANNEGEMFGLERVVNAIENSSSGLDIFDNVLQSCMAFSSDNDQADDITLLELTHLVEVEYKDRKPVASKLTPSEWSMNFSLDMESIRKFDVIPYIIQGITGLHTIPKGHSTVYTILSEIFSNALDHGVLGLDSSVKQKDGGYMEYYQMKTDRMANQKEGSIQISLSHELGESGGGRLVIHVIDSGEGYDYRNSGDDALTNNRESFGRGLALIKSLCQHVEIMGKGNAIMAIYNWE